MAGRIPDGDIDALLARLDIVEVVEQYLTLTKSGAEYEACCPFHTEKTSSFKVSPGKQFYHCFGCGAHGNAIGFVMAHQGLSFRDAYQQLGGVLPAEAGDAPSPPPAAQPVKRTSRKREDDQREIEKAGWECLMPVPAEAEPPPKAHKFRGAPSHVWTFRDAEGRVLGFTARFEKSKGGKEILPLTYWRHKETGALKWDWLAFPEPNRPLYGLDELARRPEAPVLVVEGEKCADAARAQFPDHVVVTWPGGGKAIEKIDWSPLASRACTGWGDCDAKRVKLTPKELKELPDKEAQLAAQAAKPLLPEDEQPGVMAMAAIGDKVLAFGGTWFDVRLPAPGDKPDGWDVADAIAEGLVGEALHAWVSERVSQRMAPLGAKLAKGEGSETASTPSEAGAGKKRKYERPFVPDAVFDQYGEFKACLSNVYQILITDKRWKGVVAFDEFALQTVKRKRPPYEHGDVGEWDSTDDSRTAMWLTRNYGFAPSSATVAEAIEALAKAHAFHPVREWLSDLKWDGTKRLDTWLQKYLGVPDTPYAKRVSRWWLMAAVARVLTPGCKFDYCLVLAGPQGKGKSTAFSILGGEWFGDTDIDLGHKDGMSALRGKLIYEIAELGALARSEERRQKSFLSRQVDEYRPVYGRREIKAPRQMVFGGTTNEHEWQKDPTGGRRFWPVDCIGEFDLPGLREVREQLFAEAMVYVQARVRFWPSGDEQRTLFDPEQIKVEQQESLIDALHDWVYQQVADFSLATAAMDGLKLDAGKLTRDLQTRIGNALRKLGCTKVEKRNGMTRFWYRPPTEGMATSGNRESSAMDGGDDAYF